MKISGVKANWKQILVICLFAPVAYIALPIGFFKGMWQLGIYHGERKFDRMTEWAKGNDDR